MHEVRIGRSATKELESLPDRIIYVIDDTQSIVEIRVIRHRKDAYGPT